MKRILLVLNEETPESLGTITDATSYGLAAGLCDIPNLQRALAGIGDFALRTVHHTRLNDATGFSPDYIVLSGRFSKTALPDEAVGTEYAGLLSVIRSSRVPMFGICMGLQLICRAFGAGVSLLPDGGEHGFTDIVRCARHPLTAGLPETFSCMELHKSGVVRVPDGFELLASTEACPVQMAAHRTLPLAGTQFHPELINDAHRDGLTILKNFFQSYETV